MILFKPKWLEIFFYAWTIILSFACEDSCKIWAKTRCECLNDIQEKKKCEQDIALFEGQKYFDKAKNEKACEEAIKNCACEDINNQNSSKCGDYR